MVYSFSPGDTIYYIEGLVTPGSESFRISSGLVSRINDEYVVLEDDSYVSHDKVYLSMVDMANGEMDEFLWRVNHHRGSMENAAAIVDQLKRIIASSNNK